MQRIVWKQHYYQCNCVYGEFFYYMRVVFGYYINNLCCYQWQPPYRQRFDDINKCRIYYCKNVLFEKKFWYAWRLLFFGFFLFAKSDIKNSSSQLIFLPILWWCIFRNLHHILVFFLFPDLIRQILTLKLNSNHYMRW